MPKLELLLSLCLAAPNLFAQSVRFQNQIVGWRGLGVPNQSVAVCTQPANTTTLPCSPLATLGANTATTTGDANPTTTDANGNFVFYLPQSVGKVTIQIYGPQIQMPFIEADVSLPTDLSPSIKVSSTNNMLRVGLTYATIAAALAAVPAGGGTVIVPPGTYPSASEIDLPANTLLMGSGQGSTIVQYTGTSASSALGFPHANSGAQDLTVQCTNVRATANGLGGDGASSDQTHIERVTVNGCLDLVNMGGAAGNPIGTWYVSHSVFENGFAYGDGVYTGNAGRMILTNSTVENLPNGNCVDINTSHNIVAHNRFVNCNTSNGTKDGYDVDVNPITNSAAVGNIVEDNQIIETNPSEQPDQAIALNSAASYPASGNIICDNSIAMAGKTRDAIAFNVTTGEVADGNLLCNNNITGANHAIYLFGKTGSITNTTVIGNIAAANNNGFTATSAATGTILSGNRFHGNSTANMTDGGTEAALYSSPLAPGRSATSLSGTGACASLSVQSGGLRSGRVTCKGATGASALVITPGTTAPTGWTCFAEDTTSGHELVGAQSRQSTTTCTLEFRSVGSNDVLSFSASEF
jgi:hypothetical protein